MATTNYCKFCHFCAGFDLFARFMVVFVRLRIIHHFYLMSRSHGGFSNLDDDSFNTVSLNDPDETFSSLSDIENQENEEDVMESMSLLDLPVVQSPDERMEQIEELCTQDALQNEKAAALFLLTLKEKHHLSQEGINFTVEQVGMIISSVIQKVKESVEQKLMMQSGDDITTVIADLNAIIDIQQPFLSLQTRYMQEKFYKMHFNLVEPVIIELGSRIEIVGYGTKRKPTECKDTFQYVPILLSLSALLQNKEVLEEICQDHSRKDGLLGDYCDGELFRTHTLFSIHCNALQIIAYFDEVEVCNPLGSHSGLQKLALFYYVLGNLRPELRSTHKAIQLIACVSSENLSKYGYSRVLAPFIDDVNKLSKSGILINHGGQDITF